LRKQIDLEDNSGHWQYRFSTDYRPICVTCRGTRSGVNAALLDSMTISLQMNESVYYEWLVPAFPTAGQLNTVTRDRYENVT